MDEDGSARPRLLERIAAVWHEYTYACRRLDEIRNPWRHTARSPGAGADADADAPLRWSYSERRGWHLQGWVVPDERQA